MYSLTLHHYRYYTLHRVSNSLRSVATTDVLYVHIIRSIYLLFSNPFTQVHFVSFFVLYQVYSQ